MQQNEDCYTSHDVLSKRVRNCRRLGDPQQQPELPRRYCNGGIRGLVFQFQRQFLDQLVTSLVVLLVFLGSPGDALVDEGRTLGGDVGS